MLRAAGSHWRVVTRAGPDACEGKHAKERVQAQRAFKKNSYPFCYYPSNPRMSLVPLPANSYFPIPPVMNYSMPVIFACS